MQNKKNYINTIIFGGGITGLWTLNLFKARGINAILLENNKLGCAQTGLSQGIIHGGMKYALTNKITKSTDSIKNMPDIWQQYLNQNGEFPLKNVDILSDHQLLYTPKNLMKGFKQFIYQKMLTSKCDILPKNQYQQYPDFLNNSKFKNCLCKLNENIIDIPSLIKSLNNNTQDICFNYNNIISYTPKSDNNPHEISLNIDNKNKNSEQISIYTDNIILCAGSGNPEILQKLDIKSPPKMQLRPLHMVWLKADNLPKLYLHSMQKTDKPLITISSHNINNNNNNNNKYIWYLGGDLAETGCELSEDKQIKRAKDILDDLFPDLFKNLDKKSIQCGSVKINRAEGAQANNKRPDGPVIIEKDNIITAWPTKLTFAPLVAEEIFSQIININNNNLNNILTLPKAKIYTPIWE